MAQFLDIFGFLAVVLRALTLAFGSIAVGGVVFRRLVLERTSPDFDSGRRLIAAAAAGLGLAQSCYVIANSVILSGTTGIKISELIGASYFLWGCLSVASALVLAALATKSSPAGLPFLLCAIVIILSTVATSHSAARLDHRLPLLLATTAHQIATAAWIGGLPYLLLSLAASEDSSRSYWLCRRFSSVALVSVAVLLGAGLVLAGFYTGSAEAVYGTTYGAMLTSKIILFGMILLFGAFNYKIVRQLRTGDGTLLLRLRRMAEVEIGIGITAILAAASLTSQPPGVDLVQDRVNFGTIVARMTPHWPRMTTPPLSSLSPSTLELWKRQHPDRGAAQPRRMFRVKIMCRRRKETLRGRNTIITGPDWWC